MKKIFVLNNKDRISFKKIKIVPSGSDIVHQVNFEYLVSVVDNFSSMSCTNLVVCTGSHTIMINGWGEGRKGADAEIHGQSI